LAWRTGTPADTFARLAAADREVDAREAKALGLLHAVGPATDFGIRLRAAP